MKNPGLTLITALCLSLALSVTAVGADSLVVGPGGSSARALGMGGAFVSVADDSSAVLWNPAGLALPANMETATVGASFGDETGDEIWGAWTLDEADKLSGSLAYQRRNNLIAYSDEELLGGVDQLWNRQTDYIYAVAYDVTPSFFAGVSIRNINDYLYKKEQGIALTGSAVSADAGILYRWGQLVTLGLVGNNLVSQKTPLNGVINVYDYNEGTLSYDVVNSYDAIEHPAVMSAGLSVRALPGWMFAFEVYDLGRAVSESEVRVGTEYRFSNGAAVRLGNKDGGFTWGLGYAFGGTMVDLASVKTVGGGTRSFLAVSVEY